MEMMDEGYQLLFLSGSALLVLVQSIRGWRLGVVRQLVNLGAMLLAYAAALLCGKLASPLYRHFHWTGLMISILAGSMVGCVVFWAGVSLGARLWRRTGEQPVRATRLGYGAGGSAIGFAGGLVTVWLAVIAVRLLGTVAQAEVNLASDPALSSMPRPNQLAVQLANLKHSLDSGETGAVIATVDPIPDRVYVLVAKIARVLSNVDSMNRFATYPGARALTQNPRILALRQDPEIVRSVQHRDILGLMANQRIAAVMDDPQVGRLAREFDLEKALDYALANTEKDGPAPGGGVHSF